MAARLRVAAGGSRRDLSGAPGRAVHCRLAEYPSTTLRYVIAAGGPLRRMGLRPVLR
jgi:hypothetical protein